MRSFRPTMILAAAVAMITSAVSLAALPSIDAFNVSTAAQSVAIKQVTPAAPAVLIEQSAIKQEALTIAVNEPRREAVDRRTWPFVKSSKVGSHLHAHPETATRPPSSRSWRVPA